MSTELNELLFRTATGCEHAFSSLYSSYQPVVRKIVSSLDKQMSGQADDIMQDIFLNLWKCRDTLNRIDSFDNYLFISVKNRMLSEKVKRGKFMRLLNQISQSDIFEDNHTMEWLDYREAKKGYDHAIQSLPRRAKVVMIFKYEEGFKTIDIAKIMRISPMTVKNHRQSAIKKLKRFLLPVLVSA